MSFDYTIRNGEIYITYHNMEVLPDGTIFVPSDVVPRDEAEARIAAVQ